MPFGTRFGSFFGYFFAFFKLCCGSILKKFFRGSLVLQTCCPKMVAFDGCFLYVWALLRDPGCCVSRIAVSIQCRGSFLWGPKPTSGQPLSGTYKSAQHEGFPFVPHLFSGALLKRSSFFFFFSRGPGKAQPLQVPFPLLKWVVLRSREKVRLDFGVPSW